MAEPSIRSTGREAVSAQRVHVRMSGHDPTRDRSRHRCSCSRALRRRREAQTGRRKQKPSCAAGALDRCAERDPEHAVSIHRYQRGSGHDQPDSTPRNPARAAQVRRARTIRAEFRSVHGIAISRAAGTTRVSGIGDWQDPLSFRDLYLAAQPSPESKGNTEACTSSRANRRRSRPTTTTDTSSANGCRCGGHENLFFDEMSATVGYLSGAPAELGVSKRVKYLNDRPNYGHFLVDKKLGTRAGVSADFTSVGGARTWRPRRTSTRKNCAWWTRFSSRITSARTRTRRMALR